MPAMSSHDRVKTRSCASDAERHTQPARRSQHRMAGRNRPVPASHEFEPDARHAIPLQGHHPTETASLHQLGGMAG